MTPPPAIVFVVDRDIHIQFAVDDAHLVAEELKADGLRVNHEVEQKSYFFDTATHCFSKHGIRVILRSCGPSACDRQWQVAVKAGDQTTVVPVTEETAEQLLSSGGEGILGVFEPGCDLCARCKSILDACPPGCRQFHLMDTICSHRTQMGSLPSGLKGRVAHIELDLTTFQYRGQTVCEAEVECEFPNRYQFDSDHVLEHYLFDVVKRAAQKGSSKMPRPALEKRTRMELFKARVDAMCAPKL